MKEVACAVCGAVYRFAPAEIPPAGKTLTCAKCKARVVVPGSGAPSMAGGAGDVISLADIPPPRRVPMPTSGSTREADGIDLPMPSLSTSDLGLDLPLPKGVSRPPGDPLTLDSIDLLAPVGPTSRGARGIPAFGDPLDLMPDAGVSDLPAPKRPSGADPHAPKRPSDPADLPTPKRSSDIADLPAPKRSSDIADLPVPKRASGPGAFEIPDLPVPKRPSAKPPAPLPGGLFDDLPAPKGPGIGDLPAPKRPSDIRDLPAPKRPSDPADLPAPKGYFDDLPQPRSASSSTSTTDIAPKGYFQDLPQSKGPSTTADGLAPKGFFDDLPAPRSPSAPSSGSGGSGHRSAHLDLDGLDLAPPMDGGLELEPAVASARQEPTSFPAPPSPPPTRAGSTTAVPPLELGGDVDSLAGLDLPAPSPVLPASSRGGVVSFSAPSSADMDPGRPSKSGLADLEVDTSRRESTSKPAARPVRGAATPEPVARLSTKTRRLLLIAALVFVIGGAGGYFVYQRWDAQQQRAASLRESIEVARRAMSAGGKNSWTRAANAARQVLARDPRNPEGLGLAAQALLAGYLDEGTDREARLLEAQKHIAAVPAGAGRAAPVDRAMALTLLIDGDPEAAIARLQPLATRKDGDAVLFLGWAQLAAGRWDEAIASFRESITLTPNRKLSANYGLARALLGKGDRAAARTAFLEVIAADKEHVGAMVGETEAMPANEFVQQEGALLAILQRKGIETADARVVSRAWTLAGDDALRAGRLDSARERYRKALAIDASVDAMVSMTALELRDGHLDDAAALVEKALALAPSDVAANLVAAQLDIRRSRLVDAAQRVAALRTRTPPLTGLSLGRLDLLDGMRLEAEKQDDAALKAYEAAGKVLGEDEVEPAIATAMLLGRMEKAARDGGEEAKAVELAARATERLGRLSAAAEADAALAVTLGVAYLAAGASAESEAWLRKAVARRPGDVEANFQLAEALRRQGKQDEALATLVRAFELDPTRIDLGVELARGFEAAGRDTESAALYKRLVDVPAVTIDVRIRAGRFFARTNNIVDARAQGEKILAVDAANPSGMFLRAEGLISDGHFDEARRGFQQAADAEPDPQFLDGLGRACEQQSERSGDTARRDEALRAYIMASEKDTKLLNPRLGRGRLHMKRSEFAKALAAFQEALEIAPQEPSITHGIGMSYAALGDRPKAVEWLTRSVRSHPLADAYYQLGIIHFDLNNLGPAEQALSRATTIALADERANGVAVPWLTDAYWLLGTVESARRNDAGMCRAWRSYLDRQPPSGAQSDEVRRIMLGCR